MRFSLTLIRCGVLTALITLGTQAIWGQATASIRGCGSDAKGGAVDAADTILQNDQTGFRRSVLTDATGSYQFLQVPPGTYALIIKKPGFAVSTQQGLQLAVNSPASLNVELQLASVSATVNVEAAEVANIN